MIVKYPRNGVVLWPAESIPFLTQMKLADNVMLFPSTTRFPSIISVSNTTSIFKIIVWVTLIITLAPVGGTTAAAPTPQDVGSFQYFLLVGLSKHYPFSMYGF